MPFAEESFQILWNNAVEESTQEAGKPESNACELIRQWTKKFDGEFVHFEIKENRLTFLASFPKVPIRGMGVNLVVLAHRPKSIEEKEALTKFIQKFSAQLNASASLCFVFFPEYTPFAGFDTPYFPVDLPGVVLFGRDVEQQLDSRMPEEQLVHLVRSQLPHRSLCPFDTTKPARDVMFVGRKRELEIIRQEKNSAILVYGARRIGKSSLMEKSSELYRQGLHGPMTVVEINCINLTNRYDVERNIASQVGVDEDDIRKKGLNAFFRGYSDIGKKPVALFLDEFDRVALTERNSEWPLLKELIVSVEKRYSRVFFAGYREVEHIPHDASSPFYARIREISLLPFSEMEAENLLIPPLKRFIRIPRERDFMQSAYEKSSGFPYLLHLFGEKIFEHYIDKEFKEIGPEQIEEISELSATNEHVMSVFTFNTKPKERAVAVLVAHEAPPEGWTVGDLQIRFKDKCIDFGDDEIYQACNNLVKANIFRQDKERYAFAFPLYLKIVKNTYLPNGIPNFF